MLTTAIIFTLLVAVWGRSGAALAARTGPRRERATGEDVGTLGRARVPTPRR
jgi:hypothetical protein